MREERTFLLPCYYPRIFPQNHSSCKRAPTEEFRVNRLDELVHAALIVVILQFIISNSTFPKALFLWRKTTTPSVTVHISDINVIVRA